MSGSNNGNSQNGNGYRIIGSRPVRHDGVDKVTGRALYGADLRLSDCLHGKVLRSPHAHARILSIDTSEALASPGVKAVITSADYPETESKIIDLGEGPAILKDLRANLLADGKVLYKGHPIAAVAATDPFLAREATKKIKVEYEVLKPVLHINDAMAEGSPLLHEDLHTDSLGKKSDKPSNVAKHLRFEIGDIDKGFAEADEIFEREFDTAMVHQGYIEPHNATALWNADGHLTIWSSTQGAFSVRAQTAGILNIPESSIKAVPMEIGGGFGGKIPVYLEPIAAMLSKETGKAVKMTMDRDEVFESTGPTPGSVIKVKIGVKKNGKITAADASLAYEAGAFQGSPVNCGMMCIFAPYDIEHVRVDGYDVLVNKPKTAAYRAPGATNASMASETVIDEIARWASLDPIELRKLNAAKEGTVRADGLAYPRIGYVETLEACESHEHYKAPKEGSFRGRGVASGFWFNCGFKSSVTVSVEKDGTVRLIEGSTDIGGTRTSLAMQLAEILGIEAEDVRPMVVDTDSVGYTDITGGSRVTFATGLAVIEAGKKVQQEMARRAAQLWEVDASDVEVELDVYRSKSDSSKSITFKELAGSLDETGGALSEQASVSPQGVGGGFGTHIVDVEVDPDTGKVQVLRYTAAQDVGKAIHPSYVEGQIQGGAVQGIGWAIYEGYHYNEDGHMTNANFLDYRMPTTLDLPMIDTILVEVPNPGHPFGVRGVGEVPIVPPCAALANAIYDAIGIRLRELPMNSTRVLKALLKEKGALPQGVEA